MTLPRFEPLARLRPVALVADPATDPTACAGDGAADGVRLDAAAAFVGVQAALARPGAPARLTLDLPGRGRVGAVLDTVRGDDAAVAALEVSGPIPGVAARELRSRRHGRCATPPTHLALTLTGDQVTVFTGTLTGTLTGTASVLREGAAPPADGRDADGVRWTARARTTLREHGLDGAWPPAGDLVVGTVGTASWRAGRFGQLGLRDVRLVSHADGSAVHDADGVLLTATGAGPGFFGTGHTSLWHLRAHDGRPALTARGALFVRRDGAVHGGVHGDHATHLVRDDDRWLMATCTWDELDLARRGPGGLLPPDRRPPGLPVRTVLAEAPAALDLTRGSHVLDARPWPLPTDGLDAVGVWDPHLVRDRHAAGDRWLVGFVAARRYFDFFPALAHGADLDALTLRAAATGRTATEGTTLWRGSPTEPWTVLASDGRDSAPALAARYPVFDLDLVETATVDADYPSNLPWPTVVDLPTGERWLIGFDGTRCGGPLPGYGTHGRLVVAAARA